MIGLHFKKVHKDARIPTKGTAGAGGYDLYTPRDIRIEPGELIGIDLGIQSEFPKNWEAEVRNRSSLTKKRLLIPSNCIDSDYRGNWIVQILNWGSSEFVFHVGDRVAQVIFSPCINDLVPIEVAELTSSERGEGGFGSTGR